MPVDREIRPRCLVVSIEAPWPVNTGGRARTSQIIGQLAAEYDVTVLYPAEDDEEIHDSPENVSLRPVTASLKPNWADRLGVLPRLGKVALRAIRDDLKIAIDEIDPIFIYWSHSYLGAVGMKIAPGRLNVVEFANIEGERSLSISRNSKKFRHKFSALAEYLKSMWWEPRCAKQAHLVVSLHHLEAGKLRRYNSEVVLVPNGFEQHQFSHSPSSSTRIVTMGSWTYEPNRIGLESFLKKDWPEIAKQDPLLELVVLGKGGSTLMDGMICHQSNVTVLGFIDDPSPVLYDSFCFLAPASTGGGSQLKVSEALSYHRVVVGPKFLHREVAPGLPVGSIMDTDNLPRTIIDLAKSPQLRHDVETRLQAYVSSRTWQQNFAPVQEWLFRATFPSRTLRDIQG